MAKPQDKTILVVDDEPDIVMFLSTALEEAGFNVVTAADGNEALERVKEATPDFISLDLVMPGKSGIRFFHELGFGVLGHVEAFMDLTDREDVRWALERFEVKGLPTYVVLVPPAPTAAAE